MLLYPLHHAVFVHIFRLNIRAKAHGLATDPLLNDFFDAIKGTAADKENVGRINLNKLLLGVLAPAAWGYIGHCSLQNLQQRLLHTFAAYITGNGAVLALAADFVNLVHIDNAPFGAFHIKVRRLDQAQQNIFHVLAYIPGLGQGGGVCNGKGNIQDLCQGLGQHGFAHASGTHQQDIALLQLHIVLLGTENTLIVVIYCNGQRFFCLVLADHIGVQLGLDLCRLGQHHIAVLPLLTGGVRQFGALDQVVAKANTLVTDKYARTLNQLVNHCL